MGRLIVTFLIIFCVSSAYAQVPGLSEEHYFMNAPYGVLFSKIDIFNYSFLQLERVHDLNNANRVQTVKLSTLGNEYYLNLSFVGDYIYFIPDSDFAVESAEFIFPNGEIVQFRSNGKPFLNEDALIHAHNEIQVFHEDLLEYIMLNDRISQHDNSVVPFAVVGVGIFGYVSYSSFNSTSSNNWEQIGNRGLGIAAGTISILSARKILLDFYEIKKMKKRRDELVKKYS